MMGVPVNLGKLRFPNDCKVATLKTAMFISFNEPDPAGLIANDCKVATLKTAMFISFNEPDPAGLIG
jgi:hypothetical protein